jgi:hypothetical protein
LQHGDSRQEGEKMALEIMISSPRPGQRFPGIIWNNEELKKEIAEAMQGYQNLVVTPGTEAEHKELRAKLNKLYTALEAARKDLKKRAEEPIKLFEKQVKEVEEPVATAINNLDKQLKEFEAQKKEKKRQDICEIFQKLPKPEWLRIEQIWNEKWLNASMGLNKSTSEMQETISGIESNLAVIRGMPDIAFEAERYYSESLNFAESIKRAKDNLEIQRQKQEAELKKKAEAEQKAVEAEKTAQFEKEVAQARQAAFSTPEIQQNVVLQEAEKSNTTAPAQQVQPEKLYTVTFRVTLTKAQARILGDCCRANGIVLEKVQ